MSEVRKTDETPNTKGLALIVNKTFTDYEETFEKHSDRIILCEIRIQGKTSQEITQAYAPTSDHNNETVEKFHEELQKAIYKQSCRYLNLTGDLNAKIGMRSINDNMKCVGPLEQATETKEAKDYWILPKKII